MKKKAWTDWIWPRRSRHLLQNSTSVENRARNPRLVYTAGQAPLLPLLRSASPAKKNPDRADNRGEGRRTLKAAWLL
jgi:hypothetical protein